MWGNEGNLHFVAGFFSSFMLLSFSDLLAILLNYYSLRLQYFIISVYDIFTRFRMIMT